MITTNKINFYSHIKFNGPLRVKNNKRNMNHEKDCRRYCIVFRGENVRNAHGQVDAIDHIANWKQSIFDVIKCDCVFITYPSESLPKLIDTLHPIYVQTSGYNDQVTNMYAAMEWVMKNKEKYDRFMFLRFDIVYRLCIDQWPKWKENGIILFSKDQHYYSIFRFHHFYRDELFIVDSKYLQPFYESVYNPEFFSLHHVGRDLEKYDIPLYVMYDDNIYNQKHNPLFVLRPYEDHPVIGDGYEGETVKDLERMKYATYT